MFFLEDQDNFNQQQQLLSKSKKCTHFLAHLTVLVTLGNPALMQDYRLWMEVASRLLYRASQHSSLLYQT